MKSGFRDTFSTLGYRLFMHGDVCNALLFQPMYATINYGRLSCSRQVHFFYWQVGNSHIILYDELLVARSL